MPGNQMVKQHQVFDPLADDYDKKFTHSPLGIVLRNEVRRAVVRHFNTGDHILEINCGTGEDAIWMAENGFFVTATDISPAMIKKAKEKLSTCPDEIKRRVSFQVKGFSDINDVKVLNPFDGVLSNFGGINMCDGLRKLAENLAHMTSRKASLILVPMGRWCFSEMLGYSVQLNFRKAFRRFRKRNVFQSDHMEANVYYPASSQFKASFAPEFSVVSENGLGILFPSTEFSSLMNRFPVVLKLIRPFDRLLGNLFPQFGDHRVVVMRKRIDDPN